jgi:hypothetical protein
MKRPAAAHNSNAEMLQAEHFQIAYATNDIERAMQIFRERFGIKEFCQLKGQMPSGGQIHIELAWVGNTMYELVTSSGSGSDVFMKNIPADVFTLRHHHLGYLIHNDAEWNALLATIERNGWRILTKNSTVGFMQTLIVESPELGHCLEYLYPEPAGLDFFEAVPSN